MRKKYSSRSKSGFTESEQMLLRRLEKLSAQKRISMKKPDAELAGQHQAKQSVSRLTRQAYIDMCKLYRVNLLQEAKRAAS